MKSIIGLAGKELFNARVDNLCEHLIEFNSNIGSAIGNETRFTRFFKVMRRDDGTWLAMMGSQDEFGEPIVCFGNARTLLGAVDVLGRNMAADNWREDAYAK